MTETIKHFKVEKRKRRRENARIESKVLWSFSGLIQDPVLKQDEWEVEGAAQVDSNRWRSSEGPAFAPHCRWAPRSALDAHSFRFSSGAAVQLETVPPGLLPRIPEYFICTRCGKVFWEGTHFDRALTQFQDILNLSDEDTTASKNWALRGLRAGEKNHASVWEKNTLTCEIVKYLEVVSSSPGIRLKNQSWSFKHHNVEII